MEIDLKKTSEALKAWIADLPPRKRELLRCHFTEVTELKWDEGARIFEVVVKDMPYPAKVAIKYGRTPENGPLSIKCSNFLCDSDTICFHILGSIEKLTRLFRTGKNPVIKSFVATYESPPLDLALSLLDESIKAVPDTQIGHRAENNVEQGTRLTWRIRLERAAGSITGIHVEPWEQKRSKNGGWTQGRKVSLIRLRKSSELWTNEVDKLLAKSVEQVGSKMGFRRYGVPQLWLNPLEALEILVRHDLVYWDHQPSTPVLITKAKYGLAVIGTNKRWEFLVTLDGEIIDDTDLFMPGNPCTRLIGISRQGNRVYLAEIPKELSGLFALVAEGKLMFPLDGREELMARVARLEALMPIQLPDELLGIEVRGDGRTIVRLHPEGRGIVVDLFKKPLPGGPLCRPGSGNKTVSCAVAGERKVVIRNFDHEIETASEIKNILQLPEDYKSGPWTWTISEQAEALQVVERLQYLPEKEVIVEWPKESEQIRITRPASLSDLHVRISSDRDWFGLDGGIKFESVDTNIEDLLDSVARGERYVRLSRNKYLALSEELVSGLKMLADVARRNKDGKPVVNDVALPALEALLEQAGSVLAHEEWQNKLQQFKAAMELDPKPHVTLKAELRDYQVDGFKWLARMAAWGMGCCLADDMGLGKTLQVLAVLLRNVDAGPVLVLAPSSVGFNWINEARKFAPTLNPILYRDKNRKEMLNNLGPGDLLVTSYSLVWRDIDDLNRVEWGTLVLDEAQAVKNAHTKTAKAVHTLNAKWKVAMTGTPVENHLSDLWSLFKAIVPGLFGPWEAFKQKFVIPIEVEKDKGARRALSKVVRPFILRRTKAEVLEELPSRTEQVLYAELSEEESTLYESVRLKALQDIEKDEGGEKSRFKILTALTKLRQIACHPAMVVDEWDGPSAKITILLDTLEALTDGGHRALIFSQFTTLLELVRRELEKKGISYLMLTGKTPVRIRDGLIDSFQRGSADCFLISLKAGGTGLNLTAADYVIHMDPWWNPAVEDQATDRVHRIGQTRPVTVYKLVAKGTIEERILTLHKEKKDLISGVLEGTDEAARLSGSELVELIKGGSLIY